jgi:hypothetical protein
VFLLWVYTSAVILLRREITAAFALSQTSSPGSAGCASKTRNSGASGG